MRNQYERNEHNECIRKVNNERTWLETKQRKQKKIA